MRHYLLVKIDPRLVEDWAGFRFRALVELKRAYRDLHIWLYANPNLDWDTPSVAVRCTDPTRDVVAAVEIASSHLERLRTDMKLVGYNDTRIDNKPRWIAPNSSWLEDETRWFPMGSDDDYKPSTDPVMGLRV